MHRGHRPSRETLDFSAFLLPLEKRARACFEVDSIVCELKLRTTTQQVPFSSENVSV